MPSTTRPRDSPRMPPIQPHRRFSLTHSVLAAVLLAMVPAGPSVAQEEAPAASPEAETAKPKPRPKPKPKPVAKPNPATETPAAAPVAAAPGSAWPVGANAVSESYGDWTVTCSKADEKTLCQVIQSQGDKKTGRRQFAIEFQPPRDGRAEGLLMMPFGMAIEPGVAFKLDETALGKGAPYVSCNGEGCLVPISFPTLATDAMRTAKNLLVTAQKPGAEEPLIITVPLVGFAAAIDRAVAFGG